MKYPFDEHGTLLLLLLPLNVRSKCRKTHHLFYLYPSPESRIFYPKKERRKKKTSVWCVACVTLIALLEKKFVTFSFIGVAQCSVFSVCLPQCLAAGIQKSSRANTIEAVKWAAIKQLSNTRTINDVLCQWTYQSHTLPKLITFSINVAEFDAR